VGAVGALVAATTLSGCPGTLDPEIVKMLGSGGGSGSGGSTGSGGSGSGGTNPSGGTGGSTGSGGSTADCTGKNDFNYIIAGTGDPTCPGLQCMACAQSGCHVPGAKNADVSGGLDMTLDSNIGSRLVGVMSPPNGSPTTNGSACASNTKPYLTPKSNPPTGLLLDKVVSNPPCGKQMPFPGPPGGIALTSAQVSCLKTWAEGLITAAP
jgi:hypothetical protein